MATVKLILRASSHEGHEGTLYFCVIHKRKIKQIHTGLKLSVSEWDEATASINVAACESRKEYLSRVIAKTTAMRQRLEQIISILDNLGKEYTAEDVAEKYLDNDAVVGMLSFILSFIIEHRAMG